jgi:hypothetical protein
VGRPRLGMTLLGERLATLVLRAREALLVAALVLFLVLDETVVAEHLWASFLRVTTKIKKPASENRKEEVPTVVCAGRPVESSLGGIRWVNLGHESYE